MTNRPCIRLLGTCFDIDDFASEFEQTDYNWFLMKNVNILKSPTSSDGEKIEALGHVGNLAYIGQYEWAYGPSDRLLTRRLWGRSFQRQTLHISSYYIYLILFINLLLLRTQGNQPSLRYIDQYEWAYWLCARPVTRKLWFRSLQGRTLFISNLFIYLFAHIKLKRLVSKLPTYRSGLRLPEWYVGLINRPYICSSHPSPMPWWLLAEQAPLSLTSTATATPVHAFVTARFDY